MKNVSRTKVNRCPYDMVTELLCLGVGLSEEERRRAQLHLQQCQKCRKQYSQLEKIYKQIEREIKKPVSNKILDLAKQLNDKDTVYGLIVCEPLKERHESYQQAYKTKVLFTANGSNKTAVKKLVDVDFNKFSEHSIAIRAMTDHKCNRLLLYLWNHKNTDFKGWELRIPHDSEKAVFNSAGASSIELRKIEDLDGKTIYFEEKQQDKASEEQYAKIVEAI